MRFELYAADCDTGEEFVLALVADTPEDAQAKANAAGYFVSDVVPAAPSAAAAAAPGTAANTPFH